MHRNFGVRKCTSDDVPGSPWLLVVLIAAAAVIVLAAIFGS